jgi:Ankyrin repeats (3 copies)
MERLVIDREHNDYIITVLEYIRQAPRMIQPPIARPSPKALSFRRSACMVASCSFLFVLIGFGFGQGTEANLNFSYDTTTAGVGYAGDTGYGATGEVAYPLFSWATRGRLFGLWDTKYEWFGMSLYGDLSAAGFKSAMYLGAGAGVQIPFLSFFHFKYGIKYQFLTNSVTGSQMDEEENASPVTISPSSFNGWNQEFGIGFDLPLSSGWRLYIMPGGSFSLSGDQTTFTWKSGLIIPVELNAEKSLFSDDAAEVRRALSSPFNRVNARDKAKETPLHHAIDNGDASLVTLLSRRGGRLEDGSSGLALAAGKDLTLAYLLVSEGARLDETDSSGRTPLELAIGASRYEIATMLVSRGASLSDPAEWKDLAKMAEDKRDFANAADYYGRAGNEAKASECSAKLGG